MLPNREVRFTLSQCFFFFCFFTIASLLEISDVYAAFPLSSLSCLVLSSSSSPPSLSPLSSFPHQHFQGGSRWFTNPEPSPVLLQAPCPANCSALFSAPALGSASFYHPHLQILAMPIFLLLFLIHLHLMFLLFLFLLGPTAVRLCIPTAGSTLILLIFTMPLICFFCFVFSSHCHVCDLTHLNGTSKFVLIQKSLKKKNTPLA